MLGGGVEGLHKRGVSLYYSECRHADHPSIEDKVRAPRAYLAGFGTSGSLLAGAALVFVLASAFVGFHGWPQVGGSPSSVAVSVPRTPVGTTTSRAARALAASTAPGFASRSNALHAIGTGSTGGPPGSFTNHSHGGTGGPGGAPGQRGSGSSSSSSSSAGGHSGTSPSHCASGCSPASSSNPLPAPVRGPIGATTQAAKKIVTTTTQHVSSAASKVVSKAGSAVHHVVRSAGTTVSHLLP